MLLREKIRTKALQVVGALGWKHESGSQQTIRALNYPYAFYIGKCHKMINVRMICHPDLQLKGFLNQPRMVFHLETPSGEIVRQLKEKFIPRVISTTDRLIAEGILEERV